LHAPSLAADRAVSKGQFCTTLDCVDISFLADGTLDSLPCAARIGRTRVGGIDLKKPGMRAALAAVLALSAAPAVYHRRLVAKVQPATPTAAAPSARLPTTCASSAARTSSSNPAGHAATRSPSAARTIAALLALGDQVIDPILAGIRSHRRGRKPAHWTAIDRDYETLRTGMEALFADLGVTTSSSAAA
jgi:hypothetical protein